MAGTASQFSRAVSTASRQAAKMVLENGRENIRAAGNFGPKWIDGLSVDVVPRSGALLNSVITVSHKIPFFSVFEKGATIKGNPFLWIPLSFATKVKLANFSGKLFRVNRPGLPPLLLSVDTKQPMYIGLTSVQIKKKFNIQKVIQDVMRQLPDLIKQNLG